MAVAVASTAASAKDAVRPTLHFEWSYSLDFQDTLQLSIVNRGSRSVCIPQVETERIHFYQNGQPVWSETFVSRAALGWRGTNLIAGLIVVPPRKHFSVYYNIRNWPLRAGLTRAEVRLPVYDCAEFFASQAPREFEMNPRFEFNAQPSGQRKN